jgi:pimeloyl-ACP methyl ester carboxylesterase
MVALVLLPGFDGTGRLFSDFAAAFGPEVEIVTVTYPTDIACGYAELESVARSFLPQDGPFFLLAESFSGPIGISIAASSPSGLQGLILCASFARNPVPKLALLQPLVGALPLSLAPIRVLSHFLLGRFRSPALLDALAESLMQVADAVLRARARAVLTVDVCADLSRLGIPVLYLRATEDRVVPRASYELIAALAPQVELAEFTAPHFLLQVLPAQAASRVTDFMVSFPAARPQRPLARP